MSVVKYKEIKCDECETTEEVMKGDLPKKWFKLSTLQDGNEKLNKDFCTEKCLLLYMQDVKKL